MPFTYPTTRTTGYTMGASTWNAEVVDNMRWLSGDSPSCKAKLSVAQSVGTSTASLLGFDLEVWDVGGMHSPVVNNSRFTAPVTGRYQVIASAEFGAVGVFSAFIEPYISGIQSGERSGMAFNTIDYGINSVSEFQLTAGAYVEIAVWHNFGAPTSVFGSCVVKWVGR
jgi:hypothetical protein